MGWDVNVTDTISTEQKTGYTRISYHLIPVHTYVIAIVICLRAIRQSTRTVYEWTGNTAYRHLYDSSINNDVIAVLVDSSSQTFASSIQVHVRTTYSPILRVFITRTIFGIKNAFGHPLMAGHDHVVVAVVLKLLLIWVFVVFRRHWLFYTIPIFVIIIPYLPTCSAAHF